MRLDQCESCGGVGRFVASRRWSGRASVAIAMLTLGANAIAATHFFGADLAASPTSAGATHSLAAQTAWLSAASAAGPVHTVDFESFAPMSASSLVITLAPGATMYTQTSALGPTQGLRVTNRVPPNDQNGRPSEGFNTTPGGEMHAVFSTGSPPIQIVTFHFQKKIQAFSCFISGFGSGSDFGLFDQFTYKMDWDGVGASGFSFNGIGSPQSNIQFAGFLDPAARANDVTILLRFPSLSDGYHGGYSFDDIRWVEAVDVPAPSGMAMITLGGFGLLRRKRTH